jgi:PAS domain S-box-containing protein
MPDGAHLAIVRDITERRQAEERQRAADARYRRLFEYSPDGMLLSRRGGGGPYLDANASICRMLGYTRAELLETPPEDLTVDARAAELGPGIIAAVATGLDHAGEWPLRRKDGSVFPAEVLSTRMPDGGHLVIVRDITERNRAKEAERAAQEALRDSQAELARFARIALLGEIASTISHEINQPLAAINANGAAALRWLAKDPANLDEAEAALRGVLRDSERANVVVRRIRAFYARSGPDHADFDLNMAITEVIAMARAELSEGEVTVKKRLAGGPLVAHGDRIPVQQVMVNLILNAIEAMRSVTDRPRVLTIGTRREASGRILIQVEDSGCGLDPTQANDLFQPYFTTRIGGAGLGLAICKSIIDAHGGRIWATPAPEHGAIFSFTLPAAKDPRP